MHTGGIDRNTHQPGFGVELIPSCALGNINGTQRIQEGILREILAFLPRARQTIDEVEDQFPIILYQLFDGLCGTKLFHKGSFADRYPNAVVICHRHRCTKVPVCDGHILVRDAHRSIKSKTFYRDETHMEIEYKK